MSRQRRDARRTFAPRSSAPRESPPAPARAALWPALGVRRQAAAALALAVLVGLAYANSFGTEFTLDNKSRILQDPRIRELSRERLALIVGQDYWWPGAAGLYRPLTTLSLLFNYTVLGNGPRPAGYHLVNLALHLGAAVLVWLLGLHVLRQPRLAFAAAALFALHPVATEAVTNIIGRADVLAAAAVVGGVLLHARAVREEDGRRRRALAAALGLVALLGALAKENAVTLLAVVLLYEATPRLRGDDPAVGAAGRLARARPSLVALGTALALVFALRAWVFARVRLPVMTVEDNPLVGAGFWTGRLTAVRVMGDYLLLLLWPRTLSADYSLAQVPLFGWSLRGPDLWALVSLLVVLAILGLAVACRRRRPAVFFLVLFAGLTILPTANLLMPIGALKAERFLYLPLVGFCGVLVLAVDAAARRLWPDARAVRAATALLALLAVAAGLRTAARNRDWRDELSLWSAAARAAPRSFKARLSHAAAIYARDPQARRIDEAIAEAEAAHAITDRAELVLLYLGELYRVKGDTLAVAGAPREESAAWYRRSAEALERGMALTRRMDADNRAREAARGRAPEEIDDVRNAEIYSTAALTFLRLEQLDRALEAFDQVAAIVPNLPSAYAGRGAVLALRGEPDRAAVELAQAFLLDGGQAGTAQQWAELYRRRADPGCALSPSGGLDTACPEVRAVLCEAHARLERTFVAAGEAALAERTRASAATHGCGG